MPTDDELAEAAAWAELGRRIDAFVTELEEVGLFVTVRWDRPNGNVMLRITDGIGEP